jgi:3-deoxy-7-phosphoheptulonate synthase
MAAAAAGADGIIVEVHPDPDRAACDGPQQLHSRDFAGYLRRVEDAAGLAGKRPARRRRGPGGASPRMSSPAAAA